MHVYETYCRETFDEKGRLTQIQLDYPADFNFAYDVVDAMARLPPSRKRWSGATARAKRRSSPLRTSAAGAARPPRFFSRRASAGETG